MTHKKVENPMNHIFYRFVVRVFEREVFFRREAFFFVVHTVNKNLSQNEDPTFNTFLYFGFE